MKVYNVTNTKRFFEVLSNCEGEVEIVNEEGLHISMNDLTSQKNLALMALSYAKGTIHEMELCFTHPEDTVRVLHFLSGMKYIA